MWDVTILLALQAVAGLHKQGRGHCDLKPANIMVQLIKGLEVLDVTCIDLGSSTVYQGALCYHELHDQPRLLYTCVSKLSVLQCSDLSDLSLHSSGCAVALHVLRQKLLCSVLCISGHIYSQHMRGAYVHGLKPL